VTDAAPQTFAARAWRRLCQPGWQSVLLWLFAVPGMVVAAALAMFVAYVMALIPRTPGVEDLTRLREQRPSILLSADGKELAVFRRARREWVALDDISPHVIAALIATEDHRFAEHRGIDVMRTIAAVVQTFGGERQGGSTITQQLARNMYPHEVGRAVTVERKVKEAITAMKIERAYSKDDILETYLNTVPFLYNAWGIEMAARTYFDKPAAHLNELESATLVGMLKGTSHYNPVTNPERAQQRRNTVLAQMVKHGMLTEERFEQLKDRALELKFVRQVEPVGPAPHLVQVLRRWLVDWAEHRGLNLYEDGLVVHSTIDSQMQEMATQALTRQADKLQQIADAERARRNSKQPQPPLPPQKTRLQAGFMAMDPANGYIKAWVGSRDFAQDQFDHVEQARRQPGSTFKPFVYGAAFESGARLGDYYIDQPVDIRLDDHTIWRPTDVGVPTGLPTTLRDGLAYSKNSITVQVMQRVGPTRVASVARAMGVRQSKLDAVPSLALGTSPVSLKEMVAAYATIANAGVYVTPLTVTRI